MECLQYYSKVDSRKLKEESFKPCYKWNTFNTIADRLKDITNGMF